MSVVLMPVVAGLGAGVVAAAIPLLTRSRLSTNQRTLDWLDRPAFLLSGAGLAGGVTAIMAWRSGAHLIVLTAGWLAVLAPSLAVIDVVERRLPDLLTLGSYPVIAAMVVAATVIDARPAVVMRAGLGLAIVGGCYLCSALLAAGGMGAGDVKLAGLVGLALGADSAAAAVAAMILGLVLGGVGAAVAIARYHRTDAAVPLGPAILFGAVMMAIGMAS